MSKTVKNPNGFQVQSVVLTGTWKMKYLLQMCEMLTHTWSNSGSRKWNKTGKMGNWKRFTLPEHLKDAFTCVEGLKSAFHLFSNISKEENIEHCGGFLWSTHTHTHCRRDRKAWMTRWLELCLLIDFPPAEGKNDFLSPRSWRSETIAAWSAATWLSVSSARLHILIYAFTQGVRLTCQAW